MAWKGVEASVLWAFIHIWLLLRQCTLLLQDKGLLGNARNQLQWHGSKGTLGQTT